MKLSQFFTRITFFCRWIWIFASWGQRLSWPSGSEDFFFDFIEFLTYSVWKISSKFEKLNFSKIFKIITFFRLRLRTSDQVWTPMEPIDALILLDGTIFDIFPLRKWPQIEIWTDGTSSNFNFKTLALQKCCSPSFGRFLRTPYYSLSSDKTSCSTSHWISLILSRGKREKSKKFEKNKKIKLS